jgi:serine/threonine-protein kinase
VEVDGAMAGQGKKTYELSMTPGTHKLRFLNTYAQTEEREVTVTPGQPTEVSVRVHKAKPAHLTINCADDPDVFVNGVYKGTARETVHAPVLVPLPELTSRLSVKIGLHRQGKETLEFERIVVAGETLEVAVSMRDGDATPKPREVLQE